MAIYFKMFSLGRLACPRLQVLAEVVWLAEVLRERNTVHERTAITRTLIDIEHQESYHKQRDHQRKTHDNLNLLSSPVKLAKGHIREEDEGQQEAKHKTDHMGKVVDVRQKAYEQKKQYYAA